jgi:Xaa-Pro aminopeptidase
MYIFMRTRIKKLQSVLEKENIDFTILGPTSNMFYFTGFREEQMERPLFFIVSKRNSFFFAPKIYEEQLQKMDFDVVVYNDGEDPYTKLDIPKGASLAVDDQLWSVFLVNLINKFSPSNLLPASALISPLRMVKDEEEIRTLKEGLKIAETAFTRFLDEVSEGDSECRLARKLDEEFVNLGGEGASFGTIVTSGSNTSMPHLRCTEKKIRRGDVILVDFGVKYKGYSTDTTRVVSLGNPGEEVKKIYEIVRGAQEEAENSLEGMTGDEIDSLARNYMRKYSVDQFFIHRTGHGIGIDVHEEPYISQGYNKKITRNMVFTVEPGVYIQGKFGIRLEDMVVMDGKPKVLNSLSKEIFAL